MNKTKKMWDIAYVRDHAEANADLIVSAMNACKSVNKDYPEHVAEAIPLMYEALKEIQPFFKWLDKSYLRRIRQLMEEAIDLAEKRGLDD